MLATECSQSSFEFPGVWSRSVTARFDGGKITSNAGGLLLRQVVMRDVSTRDGGVAQRPVFWTVLGVP